MIAIVSVVLALASTAPEPAPPLPAAEVRLGWSAPEGCPDAEAIRARIAALTAGRPDGVGTLEIDASVVAQPDGYALRLATTLRGESGLRELSSTECSTLADTVALVAAISLDPGLATDSPGPDEPPSEPTVLEPRLVEPPSTPPDEPAAAPVETVDPTRPTKESGPRLMDRAPRVPAPGLLLRGGLGPELGALPGPSAALRMSVGVAWPRVRLLLAATYLAPRRAEGPGDTAALYQQGSVALLGCGRFGRGAWSLPACAGIEAGGLRADGRGLQTPGTVVGPWLGPAASVGVIRTLRRGGLWLELEGVARSVATRVVIDDTLAFRPSVGSLRLLAGFEFQWR